MTEIYLVRHGQTAWNKEEIFRGRTDIPLDETGLKEAEGMAGFFDGIPIEAIYASPLTRAWQTAEALARPRNLEIQRREGLIDMCFGRWERRAFKEVMETESELFRVWVEETHRLAIPGGETIGQVQERAMAVVNEVADRHAGKAVVLVTHRVVNKLIILGALGIDTTHFWQMDQHATAINLIRKGRRGFKLGFFNEACHLRDLQRQGVRTTT
jgi:broad specificity phosphatase PhoE